MQLFDGSIVVQHLRVHQRIAVADRLAMAYSLTGLIEIASLRLSLDNKYMFEDVEEFLQKQFITPMIRSKSK